MLYLSLVSGVDYVFRVKKKSERKERSITKDEEHASSPDGLRAVS